MLQESGVTIAESSCSDADVGRVDQDSNSRVLAICNYRALRTPK